MVDPSIWLQLFEAKTQARKRDAEAKEETAGFFDRPLLGEKNLGAFNVILGMRNFVHGTRQTSLLQQSYKTGFYKDNDGKITKHQIHERSQEKPGKLDWLFGWEKDLEIVEKHPEYGILLRDGNNNILQDGDELDKMVDSYWAKKEDPLTPNKTLVERVEDLPSNEVNKPVSVVKPNENTYSAESETKSVNISKPAYKVLSPTIEEFDAMDDWDKHITMNDLDPSLMGGGRPDDWEVQLGQRYSDKGPKAKPKVNEEGITVAKESSDDIYGMSMEELQSHAALKDKPSLLDRFKGQIKSEWAEESDEFSISNVKKFLDERKSKKKNAKKVVKTLKDGENTGKSSLVDEKPDQATLNLIGSADDPANATKIEALVHKKGGGFLDKMISKYKPKNPKTIRVEDMDDAIKELDNMHRAFKMKRYSAGQG